MGEDKKFRVMANDPSLCGWGWAVLDWRGEVVASGAERTNPKATKMRVRKGDDLVRRCSEITTALLQVIDEWKVEYLVSELPSGSQSASAAVMIGIVTGVVQTLSASLYLPIEWYSQQDAKKAAMLPRRAGKKAMLEAMRMEYKNWEHNVGWMDEAIADALAVHNVARKQSPVLMYMRNTNSQC